MSGQACPFCKGRGRVEHTYRDADAEPLTITLTCDPCSATGDLEMMRLLRAYRLGRAHEHACVVAELLGTERPATLGAEAIRRAVLDDDSRFRYEEQLRTAMARA